MIKNFIALTLLFNSAIPAFAATDAKEIKRLHAAEDLKCRATQEFKKMCEACKADKSAGKPTCAPEVVEKRGSKEFVAMIKTIHPMLNACGFNKIPPHATLDDFLSRLGAVCRNEEKVPDMNNYLKD